MAAMKRFILKWQKELQKGQYSLIYLLLLKNMLVRYIGLLKEEKDIDRDISDFITFFIKKKEVFNIFLQQHPEVLDLIRNIAIE